MEEDYASENMTKWEEVDPLNPYEYEEVFQYHTVHRFIQEYIVSLIKILLCIIIIVNNSLLIYVILKFKRLQTKTNYIILNLAANTLLYCTLNTTITVLEVFVSQHIYFNFHIYTIITFTLYFALEVSVLLALLLALDWYILANKQNILSQYQKSYKWIVATVYFIPFLVNFFILILIDFDYYSIIIIGGLSTFLLYVICMLAVSTVNVIKFRKTYTQESLRTAYALYVSNIFFLMWLPMLLMIIIYLLLTNFTFIPHSLLGGLIMTIIAYCVELFAFSFPIVMTIMLKRKDKNFKMSFDSLIKRSVQNYLQDDINDIIDVDEPNA